MAEEKEKEKVKVVQGESKVNKNLIYIIVFLIILILILIVVKFFKPNIYFYIFIFGAVVAYIIFALRKEKKENYYDIIRKVQIETFINLPNATLNTASNNVQCIEVGPDDYVIHFFDLNRAYSYKNGVITGMQIRSLYNIKQDREKLSYLKEIARYANQKDIITKEASEMGLALPGESEE